MSNEECDSCPLIVEVQKLKDDHERIIKDIEQLKHESKQNEYGVTKLSKDLALHMMQSENRDSAIFEEVKNMNVKLSSHMEDEGEVVNKLGEKLDEFSEKLFDPENGLFFKLKDDVKDNQFKSRLMWGVMTSIGVSALSVVAYLVKDALGG